MSPIRALKVASISNGMSASRTPLLLDEVSRVASKRDLFQRIHTACIAGAGCYQDAGVMPSAVRFSSTSLAAL